jgi:hypothetical protein
MKKKMTLSRVVLLLLVASCAWTDRQCNGACNGALGANYIVVQYRMDGTPLNCWRLQATSIGNEENSDGIYWNYKGQQIHLSGLYNYVQVSGENWDQAATEMSVNLSKCDGGHYAKGDR